MIETLEALKSGELVFEHYKSKGFQNTLIGVGIQNIIGICKKAIEQIAKRKEENNGSF